MGPAGAGVGTFAEALRLSQDPVPVQDGHVLFARGTRVPAQQVIVKWTDLAGSVMVPDIVVIGLRKRNVKEAEDQKRDPRKVRSRSSRRPLKGHVWASSEIADQQNVD
jgi:1-acyl-sn-glycerol-3-phosphate acyltransferase